MNTRRMALAAILALCAAPVRAGSVTYDFIEGVAAPHPSMVGATLTFASPPALADSGWSLSDRDRADILDFRVTDSATAPIGSYTPQLVVADIVSSGGASLDAGSLFATMGIIRLSTRRSTATSSRTSAMG